MSLKASAPTLVDKLNGLLDSYKSWTGVVELVEFKLLIAVVKLVKAAVSAVICAGVAMVVGVLLRRVGAGGINTLPDRSVDEVER